jgi:hypothetical protein
MVRLLLITPRQASVPRSEKTAKPHYGLKQAEALMTVAGRFSDAYMKKLLPNDRLNLSVI